MYTLWSQGPPVFLQKDPIAYLKWTFSSKHSVVKSWGALFTDILSKYIDVLSTLRTLNTSVSNELYNGLRTAVKIKVHNIELSLMLILTIKLWGEFYYCNVAKEKTAR